MAYNSKYTGQEVENLLDQVANGNTGGGGTQVQADWRESNKSNPSFIKNKPNIWQEYENGEPIGSIEFNSPISVTSFNFQTPLDVNAGNILFDESGIHYSVNVTVFDNKTIDIIHTGDGTKFLADDGTYKEVSGGGGGGITSESDPIFSASPAFNITDEDIDSWNGKQDAISDLEAIRSGASKGATAVQPSKLASVATSGDYNDLSNKPTIPTKLSDLRNGNILTCEFMGEVGDVIWSEGDDHDRIDYIADWMEALSLGKVCVLDFDEYEDTYAMVHAINYRNDVTYGIGKVYFSYIFEGYLYDIEYESVSLPVTMTIVSKTKIGGEGGSNTDGGTEPMVCAYRITSYTANHIELENYTYNGQTMYYREGAIISILNPNSADVVFEGGTLTLTLDGNEYEASAFTIKSGATALFSLGPDPGVLLPISSVGGATTSYVDQAIANAITNTLNTPV